jgi:hypothetical protein
MSEELGFYFYEVKSNGKNCRYLSPLPMDIVKEKGLIAEAIAGEVVSTDESNLAEGFKTNPAFVRFLQWSIAQHAGKCDAIEKQALRIQNGNVVVPDFRKPNAEGGIDPEEVIGLVEVKDGQIVKFHGSPDYVPFSGKGFLKLDAYFQQRYETDLMAYIEKSAAKSSGS